MIIETDRLRLRPWTDADRPGFAAICADPEVMRYLGPLQSRANTDAAIDRALGCEAANGFSFRAVERRDDGALLGFCGLKPVTIDCPIKGAIEIGWRLRRDAWGQGYAFEAARATKDHCFVFHKLPGIVSMTVAANERSWRLMERIGLSRHPQYDFDHPGLAIEDPLRPHIVYARGAG